MVQAIHMTKYKLNFKIINRTLMFLPKIYRVIPLFPCTIPTSTCLPNSTPPHVSWPERQQSSKLSCVI